MSETIETTGERLVTFESDRLSDLRREVEKLNKTAAKIGVEPIVLEVLGRETVERRMPTPDGLGWYPVRIEMVECRLTGASPVLPGGWRYVGAIEHLEAGNLLHGSDDDGTMSAYREAKSECVHCGFRRNRNKTLIVRSEEGELAQVGSSCLKDFLGYHGDPERVVRWVDAVLALGEDDEDRPYGSGRSERGIETDSFLTVVAAVVRTHGWTAKSSPRGVPTAELVGYVIGTSRVPNGRDFDGLREMVEAVKIEDRDSEEGRAVADWARTIPSDAGDYLGNVRVALGGSYILSRHFGIAASAVSARRREEERETKKAVERGERAASEWVGEVGTRIELEVEVRFLTSYETDFGTTYVVKMVDLAGNSITAKTSGRFGYEAAKDDRYWIKGTVKEHSEWNGSKETILSRVAIVLDLTIVD